VQRARGLVSRAAIPPAAAPARRAALRTRPTITGNMDVKRDGDESALFLRWDATPAVASWEVRVSERPDARGDYVVRDRLSLDGSVTNAEIRLGERPLRIHVLGRRRDGRLLRRAVISGLTSESWRERWRRRASAS
jgi:hypothetical protein